MYGEIAYKYGHITRTINMHGEIVHKCGHINIHNRYDEIEWKVLTHKKQNKKLGHITYQYSETE